MVVVLVVVVLAMTIAICETQKQQCARHWDELHCLMGIDWEWKPYRIK